MNRSSKYKNRPKSSMITLSDFMRIQKEIIPSKNADQNRSEIDKALKTQSKFHITNFPDVTKKTQDEIDKENFLEAERRRRQIDLIESQYQQREKDLVNKKAKKNLFEGQDDIKTFNSQLLMADVLKEREYQLQIAKQKKEMEKKINDRYYQQQLKQMEEYDKNEMIKEEQAKEKKIQQFQIVEEQVQAQKMRNIQDYQEKQVEGIIAKQNILDGIEEDKKKEQEKEMQKKKQREQFIKANEDLEKLKIERRKKEKEEERKIEEYAIKKQQMEDFKKKVAKEKFDFKQAQRQKIIDAQIENLQKIKSKEEKILQKQIKEAEEKKEKEEAIKTKRRNELKKQMEENRAAKRKANEEAKLRTKIEEKAFIDNWKERMKQLDQDEKEEKEQIRQRNKEVQQYQLQQMKDKKMRATQDFEKRNEIAIQTQKLLKDEHDDYFEYVTGWINEYQKQGKDITPLLLELKRYKKRNNLE